MTGIRNLKKNLVRTEINVDGLRNRIIDNRAIFSQCLSCNRKALKLTYMVGKLVRIPSLRNFSFVNGGKVISKIFFTLGISVYLQRNTMHKRKEKCAITNDNTHIRILFHIRNRQNNIY